MTSSQFAEFVKAFRVVFPSFDRWASRLDDQAATLRAWYPAFADVDFETAQRIIPLMRDEAVGYEPMEATHFEDFPRVLPRYCRKWEYTTSTYRQEEERRQTEGTYEGAFQHVTEGDAVMSSEFQRLTKEMERILGHSLPVRDGDDWTPKQLCDAALHNLGGVNI